MKNKVLVATLVLLMAWGCASRDVYFEYNPIPESGWSKDSMYVFHIPITDTVSTYNVYINIRNRGEYPYQNMWLYINKITPDETLTKDSIEFYLADERGKWLGSGIGSVVEMPVLYKQNVKFEQKGTYDFRIVHGMRDSLLKGINDVGLRVEKIE